MDATHPSLARKAATVSFVVLLLLALFMLIGYAVTFFFSVNYLNPVLAYEPDESPQGPHF